MCLQVFEVKLNNVKLLGRGVIVILRSFAWLPLQYSLVALALLEMDAIVSQVSSS